METTTQALFVTAAGMILLFLALGVLMLFMNITSRLLPYREEPAETAEEGEPAEAVASDAAPDAARGAEDLSAVIAAAAVALALAERDAGFSPPTPTGSGGADSWVIFGRQAQMLTRQPR